MSAEPVETLVERVREALQSLAATIPIDSISQPRDALAALTELAERLAESGQRVRELEDDPDRPTVTYAGDELEACEERLEAAERERDECVRAAQADYAELRGHKVELAARVAALEEARAKDAEAFSLHKEKYARRIAALEEALQEIADLDSQSVQFASVGGEGGLMRKIARAALRVEGDEG